MHVGRWILGAALVPAIAAATIVEPPPRAAPSPSAPALDPAGKWTLDVSPGGCLLQRAFGDGPRRLTFGLRRVPLAGGADVLLVAARPLGSGQGALRYADRVWSGRYSAAPVQGGWLATARLAPADLDGLAAAPEIDLAFGGTKAILRRPELDHAAAAERSCETAILTAWGLDPAEPERVATAAAAVRGPDWPTAADYPKSAWTNGVAGRAIVVWTVDAAGRSSDCRAVQSSGSAVLDDASCRLALTRARYAPARGRDGQPTASHVARVVNWSLAQ